MDLVIFFGEISDRDIRPDRKYADNVVLLSGYPSVLQAVCHYLSRSIAVYGTCFVSPKCYRTRLAPNWTLVLETSGCWM